MTQCLHRAALWIIGGATQSACQVETLAEPAGLEVHQWHCVAPRRSLSKIIEEKVHCETTTPPQKHKEKTLFAVAGWIYGDCEIYDTSFIFTKNVNGTRLPTNLQSVSTNGALRLRISAGETDDGRQPPSRCLQGIVPACPPSLCQSLWLSRGPLEILERIWNHLWWT